MKTKTCQHGHRYGDGSRHDRCFTKYQGVFVPTNILDGKYLHWYDLQDYKIGYLDIEASGLQANQAWMLSWAIKPLGGNPVMDFVEHGEIFVKEGKVNVNYDQRIVSSLVKEMLNYDLLVTYYGTGFDLPFIRTRSMYYNFQFPKFGDVSHIDLYYSVKSKMLLSRNSLKMATQFLEITGKTTLDFSYWGLAAMGDKESMKELIHHNTEDVKILEQLHKKIEPYCKWSKRSL